MFKCKTTNNNSLEEAKTGEKWVSCLDWLCKCLSYFRASHFLIYDFKQNLPQNNRSYKINKWHFLWPNVFEISGSRRNYLLLTVVRETDEVFRSCQAGADKSSPGRWTPNNCLTRAKNFNNLLRSFCNERKCCQNSKDS